MSAKEQVAKVEAPVCNTLRTIKANSAAGSIIVVDDVDPRGLEEAILLSSYRPNRETTAVSATTARKIEL